MDILHDSTKAVLLNIGNTCQIPKYVLDSEALEKTASYDFRDTLFADEDRRQFPLDSKASTWLSAAYFAKTAEIDYKNKAVRDYMEGRIKKAADIHGIRKDVDDVMERIRTTKQEKQAADSAENWGCFSKKLYPMFDKEGVKQANAYFEENCYKLLPVDRHEVARNIVKKCAEYGMDYNDTVRMEAGLGMPDRSFLMENVIDRVSRIKDPATQVKVSKMAEALMKADTKEFSENLEKLAGYIEDLDHDLGLDKQYNRTVLPPSRFCFDISIKEAEEQVKDSVEMGGHVFSLKKLAELPVDVYTNALGDDFGDRIKTAEKIDESKLRDELYSLPLPDKKALVRSIQSYAV